jgi:hypothetical protein
VWPTVTVCENFVCQAYDATVLADRFIKERLSFIEIAFRRRGEEIAALSTTRPGGSLHESVRRAAALANTSFQSRCVELNARLRQAGTKLDYHNGFLQLVSDETTTTQIDRPFWSLVASPKWLNVDRDMKEAIDLRDSGGRDPAWYAAKALESTSRPGTQLF